MPRRTKSYSSRRPSPISSTPPPPSSPSIPSSPSSPSKNTLFSTVAEGFAFGIGRNVADKVVETLTQPDKPTAPSNMVMDRKVEEKDNKDLCLCQDYLECIKSNTPSICNEFDFCKK